MRERAQIDYCAGGSWRKRERKCKGIDEWVRQIQLSKCNLSFSCLLERKGAQKNKGRILWLHRCRGSSRFLLSLSFLLFGTIVNWIPARNLAFQAKCCVRKWAKRRKRKEILCLILVDGMKSTSRCSSSSWRCSILKEERIATPYPRATCYWFKSKWIM